MGQEDSPGDRISEGEEERLNFLGYSITANEIHAAQLGLCGVFAGMGYSAGLIEESLLFSLTLMGVAHGLGLWREAGESDSQSIASLSTRHEPWWFTASYFVSFFSGSLFHNLSPIV